MKSSLKNKPTVLVVEDEGLVRLDAVETLRGAGFAVVEAANADEALAVVTAGEAVDVLFTDINMPGRMDGLELAWRVNRLEPRIHLLLTSGKVRPPLSEIPDDGGFIPKPYSPEAVTRAVSRMLA
ncbi:MAG: response regulator [Caulobacteraceae bacterium]